MTRGRRPVRSYDDAQTAVSHHAAGMTCVVLLLMNWMLVGRRIDHCRHAAL